MIKHTCPNCGASDERITCRWCGIWMLPPNAETIDRYVYALIAGDVDRIARLEECYPALKTRRAELTVTGWRAHDRATGYWLEHEHDEDWARLRAYEKRRLM